MSVPSTELLVARATGALQELFEPERAELDLDVWPETLVDNLARAVDMLRRGPQPFAHISRNQDRTACITKGTGELGGGIWPLRVSSEADRSVGLRIKNMSGSIVTADGVIPSSVERVLVRHKPQVLSLGRNIIVDEEPPAEDMNRALEDLEWMMNPWEKVLVVGSGALSAFEFGLAFNPEHRPKLGRLVFGSLPQERVREHDSQPA
jgi:hypothetical protein